MGDSMILGVGSFVFTMLVIGIALTIREFRHTVYPLEERGAAEKDKRNRA